MSEQSEPEEGVYGLVMPFVCVSSKGGPYDDTAYCAGYEVGQLSTLLEQTRPEEVTRTVRTANLEQFDLVAMWHNYVIDDTVVHDETWATILLRRVSEVQDNPRSNR